MEQGNGSLDAAFDVGYAGHALRLGCFGIDPSVREILKIGGSQGFGEERSHVLGHAVEDWPTLKARIGPDLFWDQAHRRIFTAMLALEEREEPVDKETIVEQLMRDGSLKDGDVSLLSRLDGGFGASMLEPYLRKLENVCTLRQAALHAQKIVNEACMTGAP